jgi:hypothetical protein
MKNDKVLYTDGHDVMVTDSVLQVKKKWYKLNDITGHGLSIIQPARLPSFLMFGMGILFSLAGGTRVIDASRMNIPIGHDPNRLLFLIGICCIVFGVVLALSIGERYAVRITTSEGEKDVVISRKKEYITQIVRALNNAFFARLHGDDESKPRDFMVSAR